jgi:hypothetical protein
VAADPVRFLMPLPSDERYQWVRARLAELEPELLRELIVDAWTMVVPKRVAADYLAQLDKTGQSAPPSDS